MGAVLAPRNRPKDSNRIAAVARHDCTDLATAFHEQRHEPSLLRGSQRISLRGFIWRGTVNCPHTIWSTRAFDLIMTARRMKTLTVKG